MLLQGWDNCPGGKTTFTFDEETNGPLGDPLTALVSGTPCTCARTRVVAVDMR